MAEFLKDTLFKYLTAFQLVIACFLIYMNIHGFENDRDIVMGVALLVTAVLVYKKDKDNKVDLQVKTHTPMEEAVVRKAVDILCEEYGITDTKEQEIELLKKLTERQAARISELEASVDG